MREYFISNQKYDQLISCLRFLFEQKYTRFSSVNHTHEFSPDIFQFACAIYKRGINTNQIDKKSLSPLRIPTISNEFRMPKISFFDEEQWGKNLINISNKTFFILVDKNFFHFNDMFFCNFHAENYFLIEATEEKKNLDTVSEIIQKIDALLEKMGPAVKPRDDTYQPGYDTYQPGYDTHQPGYDTHNPRNGTHIIAIGGGITLDVAGFVASILSAKLTLIPTTFLACIDATIGGKTGVNFEPYGKNQIGSFYFCDEIIIAPHFFKTLPSEEVISGLCEALKHSWISGNFSENKTIFECILTSGLQNISKNITSIISNNLQTKLKVVSHDPYELSNIRTILNFGHTYGHAIEMLALKRGKTMPHGIAIAHGMNMVIQRFYPSKTLEMQEFLDFLNQILVQYPFDLPEDLEAENEFTRLLGQDKKNTNSHTIAFSLPQYGHINLKEFQNG